MATLKFNDTSYIVDHAVKGDDYVHGYDESGVMLVAIEGIEDFSTVTYDGTYMSPEFCAEEECNKVRSVVPVVEDGNMLQITNIYAGTTELDVGVSELPAGTLYLVYE